MDAQGRSRSLCITHHFGPIHIGTGSTCPLTLVRVRRCSSGQFVACQEDLSDVSRELKLNPVYAPDILQAWPADDLRLQIDVRLNVDPDSGLASRVPAQQRSPSSRDLERLAGTIYDARRKRDRMLAETFFGEPAWDMLLALYCFPSRGEELYVTSLSYAANVPLATGHRVQEVLSRRGLIERSAESADGRRMRVRLSDKGRALLESYLSALFSSNRTFPYSSALAQI